MDLKATALLKLIYLEMFGHDMSWASFHVLEVMSSPKYMQKRVGYLAAVQSFRQDTEVLMLTTNLLKKDVSSVSQTTISLPLLTLPHIISPPLALSLLTDILPRLSHSSANVRKKAVATLYRLALVYPDSLKSAWPKIKDLLMDDGQDPSVTAAIINVICEFGWRRPGDFLALAPRFFEFLVDEANNWMVIKIIKLFASLTPLEPRLIKKILPPLTTLIRTTPAMSVLYECINGIIQGGVLHNEIGTHEVEEIASLCVTKLRSMIAVDGDPNLKYVALLAFDYFIRSYPHLVSSQEDVIMECIDDPDISIRLKALALSEALVNVDSLVPLVSRLLQQLDRRQTSRRISVTQPKSDPTIAIHLDPEHTPPGGDPKSSENFQREDLALTTDQRNIIIRYVIRMCSSDNYRNVLDFEWYIDVLLRLTELSPSDSLSIESQWRDRNGSDLEDDTVSYALGWQLRNIAVRVEAVRSQTVAAAMWLLSRQHHCQTIDMRSISGAILSFAAWIAGEYIAYGRDAQSILDSLLCPDITSLHPTVICSYLQAIPKVFAHLVSKVKADWSTEDRTMIDLQVTRIIYMLEPLTFRSELEVQERAVGFFELFKIVSQALQAEENAGQPLLLTKALPHLFNTHELHPVAPSAQRKVPPPGKFDLDACINPDLLSLLQVQPETPETSMVSSYELFYHARASQESRATPILAPVPSRTIPSHSYQQTEKARSNAPAPKREEHEDPFYIQYQGNGFNGRSPLHEVIQASNGSHIDIDAIPIMNLELEPVQSSTSLPSRKIRAQDKQERSKIRVAEDVTVEDFEKGSDLNSNAGQRIEMKKRNVLGVNSHEIGNISLLGSAGLEDGSDSGLLVHDAEMSKAIADVERLRLEMQRASERVEVSDGVPAEGTLVKKKKRRQPKGPAPTAPEHFEGSEADLTSRGKPRRLKKKRQKSPPDTTLSIPVKEEMND